MKDQLLEMEHIHYAYPDSPFVLRDLSLCIKGREKIAVLGNNGAGKSTFFLLCNGVLAPDSGSLQFRGQAVDFHKKRHLNHLREKIGIVFQDPNQQLIGPTVEAEVSFGPMNLKLPREEVQSRVLKALEDMQLTAYRDRPPHFLSGGEKKRVGIAGVLAMQPDMILFDEPTASLDPLGVQMLESVLAGLEAEGKTLLISTHDIDFAWRWAERILVFNNGLLIADDLPEHIFSNPLLLTQAGLRTPYLYDFGRLLQKQGRLPQDAPLPKTMQELETLLVGQ